MSRWLSRLIGRVLGIEFCYCEFTYAGVFFDDVSAKEWINFRAADLAKEWMNFYVFPSRNAHDFLKIDEYLLQKVYGYMLEFAELELISKIRGGPQQLILIPRGIGSEFLAMLLQPRIRSYSALISNPFRCVGNPTRISNEYLGMRRRYMLLESMYIFTSACLWILIHLFTKNKKPRSESLGVRQLQRKVRKFEINDLYWLWDQDIQFNVIHIEQYALDEVSIKLLEENNVHRVRICKNLRDLIDVRRDARIVVASGNLSCSLRLLLKSMMSLFRLVIPSNWSYQSIVEQGFTLKVYFWQSIYKSLNIKILWTMADMPIGLLPEAQALRNIGALQAGSTWSYHPFADRVVKKNLDIFFHWGAAHQEIFSNPVGPKSEHDVLSGFPLDYYFNHYKEWAEETKKKFGNKFVLAFIDNIHATNGLYSYDTYRILHYLLLRILESHTDVVVLLKPKRENVLDKFLSEHPRVREKVDSGRMQVFAGAEEFDKFPPAAVGLVSDLVIGMGFSTATIECGFAGTPCMFYDENRIRSNALFKCGENEFVFTCIEELERAIDRAILDRQYLVSLSVKLALAFKAIDPYRDGKGHARVAAILSCLFDSSLSHVDMSDKIKSCLEGKLAFEQTI